MTTVTVSQRPHEGHIRPRQAFRERTSQETMFKLRSDTGSAGWHGCVSVCVCNSGPEGTSEPGPVVGRGPGAGNMVWLRGASSCRGSAREGGVS